MPSREIPPDEVEAALAARRELGRELEPQVVDAFVDRIERAIDARIDERLAARGRVPDHRERRPVPLLLPLASLGIGIGATGAATGMGDGGLVVAIVAWLVIGLVNLGYAYSR